MKTKILLHLPHASTRLTDEFLAAQKAIGPAETDRFNYAMTDLFTDELFPADRYETIAAPYSRICVDVEKLPADAGEPLSRFGRGCIYTRTEQGQEIFRPSPEYCRAVLEKYYVPHHARLEAAVRQGLAQGGRVLLIDGHSFSDEIVMNAAPPFPDLCIGISPRACSPALLGFAKSFFGARGYWAEINFPYAGAMLPDSCAQGEVPRGLSALMLEVHRRLYLDGRERSAGFAPLCRAIAEFLAEAGDYV